MREGPSPFVRRGLIERLERAFLYGALGVFAITAFLVFGLSRATRAEGGSSVGLMILPTATPFTASPTPVAPARTSIPAPRVAILAGHWSPEDPAGVATIHDTGAICADGLKEVVINKQVADQLETLLIKRGFSVALLAEFDPRLKSDSPDFASDVFLSIHSDSCVSGADYPLATGYKIAHAEPSLNPDADDRLVACLTRDYQGAVDPFKLTFNRNTITTDMTQYHAFRKIAPTIPAAIIELGFLGRDREILTKHPDALARGLERGLTSFLKGDRCGLPEPLPAPSETPPSQ